MRGGWRILVAVTLCFGAPAVQAKPAEVAAAVANQGARSADNIKLDGTRKPAELLAFLGLKPGMRVADPFGGNLYWAEITAPAVGPKGRVTIWEPKQFYDQKAYDGFTAFVVKQPNVSMLVSPFEAPNLPANAYDFMLINMDYHDVYWESAKYGIVRMEPDPWLKTVFDAMRPGGVVGVVDHVAAAGQDPRVVADKLHRIDPALVKADFERAGFKLEAESDLYRNPADDHSKLVFDPAIRGKTDRFAFRFRKPR